jgi:hypothetical protein
MENLLIYAAGWLGLVIVAILNGAIGHLIGSKFLAPEPYNDFPVA